MKRWIAALLLLFALPVFAESPLRGYSKELGGYQYVQMGEYPYEKDGTKNPVLWQILEVKDGRALLITEAVIDVQQVVFCSTEKASEQRRFRKLAKYNESDLHTWLNDTMLAELLYGTDLEPALVESENGKLFPLTDEQFMNPEYGFSANRYGTSPQRFAFATPYALHKKLYPDWGRRLYIDSKTKASPYWVATVKNPKDIKLQIVGYDGHLSYGVYTRTNIGIRPSVLLDVSLLAITQGNGTKDMPFVLSLKKPQ